MPEWENSNIVSETKFVRMIAMKSEVSRLSDYKQEKDYNLVIYVNGINIEFPASEGSNWWHLTQDQAWKRVEDFERAVACENKAYIQETVNNALNFINKKVIENE